jgi:hypothetical protein
LTILAITAADREAAKTLREALAEVSDFWHCPGDEGILCQVLAAHRIQAERRLFEQLAGSLVVSTSEPNLKLSNSAPALSDHHRHLRLRP